MTTTQTKKQVDHADYTLVLANQDQIQQHLAGTFVPWGRGNTFEVCSRRQYITDAGSRRTPLPMPENGPRESGLSMVV
jgi:hypothetical protein